MNIKQEVEEVLVDSIKKSFLFPFKEILGVEKIPKSIWEDSFLGGFLFSYFSQYLSYLSMMASMDGESFDMESEDFERIINTIDTNNKKLIMDNLTLHFNRKSMSGEINPDYEENEYQRGEELAKKVLYLGYKENDVMSFDFNFDDDDEDVIFAYKKAETIHEILSNAYPGSPVIENMTRDQAASQALTHYRVFEYVKENKDRFIKSKTGIYDSPLTLREVYKYSKSNLGKGLKSGFNNVLDADLKKIGNKIKKKLDKKLGEETVKIALDTEKGFSEWLSDLFVLIKGVIVIVLFIIITVLISQFF